MGTVAVSDAALRSPGKRSGLKSENSCSVVAAVGKNLLLAADDRFVMHFLFRSMPISMLDKFVRHFVLCPIEIDIEIENFVTSVQLQTEA